MEIRLIGTEAEIEAAVALIKQSFTIHQDGGSYQGRNPRYSSANQNQRIRKLVVSPKPVTPRTGGSGDSYRVPVAEPQPRDGDAVLGKGKPDGE